MRDIALLNPKNSLEQYTATPRFAQQQYQTVNGNFLTKINDRDSIGGSMDTVWWIIENMFFIVKPIQSVSLNDEVEGPVETIEVCTPEDCTTLPWWDSESRLATHFSDPNQVYYVWPNYYLIRIYTDDTVYQQLATVQLYDINNLAQFSEEGLHREINDQINSDYNKELMICYAMEEESERQRCLDDAKEANTITLDEACTADRWVYKSFLAIEPTIAQNTETMSRLKEGESVYYIAQHSDNVQYVWCENNDHAVSFHRVDCSDMAETEISRMSDMGSLRLSYCGLELAGLWEDDTLFFSVAAYEWPYCATAERYELLNIHTKERTKMRLLPENIEAVGDSSDDYVLLDIEDSKERFDTLGSIFHQAIGERAECGVWQYTITSIEVDTLTVKRVFGAFRDQKTDQYHALTKDYTLTYSEWALTLQ